MNSPMTIRLERETTDRQWGFALQGGADYPFPLSLQLVNPHTLAHSKGLEAGDQIIAINGRNTKTLTHQEAKMEIVRTGNELELTVIKRAVNQSSISAPQSSPKTKPNVVQLIQSSNVIKPSYSSPSQPQAPLNNHHSQVTIQIAGRSGNERTYQTVTSIPRPLDDHMRQIPEQSRPKISNFEVQPTYSRDSLHHEMWTPQQFHDNPPTTVRHIGTAVYHAQYNSPIGLYSDDKVLEAFKTQAGDLIDEIKSNNFTVPNVDDNSMLHQPSPTYQAVMNSEQQKHVPYSSEGKLSRSFRALEQDLSQVEGTSEAPRSIFNQRHQI